jgi:hypothetical protein
MHFIQFHFFIFFFFFKALNREDSQKLEDIDYLPIFLDLNPHMNSLNVEPGFFILVRGYQYLKIN